MGIVKRPVALVTGGSRGIGAASALALAGYGYDVIVTYRNKAARAEEVVVALGERGVRGLAVGGDVTRREDVERLFAEVAAWGGRLDCLVLNASGGLERDLVVADPLYPMHINRDAQLVLLDGALPLMSRGGRVVFVTSHWAHLYGQIAQIPAYTPIAESKYAGELALRARQPELAERGIHLIVVTGDLVEGTITPKLLERTAPGLMSQRREGGERLPTAAEMGEAIARAAVDERLTHGETIVVGGSLTALLAAQGGQ